MQIVLLQESINALNGTVVIPEEKVVIIRAVSPPATRISSWDAHSPRSIIIGDGSSPLFRVEDRGKLMLSNVILSGGQGTACGGGVVVVGEGLLIAQESEFVENKAERGGAICVERTGQVTSATSQITPLHTWVRHAPVTCSTLPAPTPVHATHTGPILTSQLRLYSVDFRQNKATSSADAGVGDDIYLMSPKTQYARVHVYNMLLGYAHTPPALGTQLRTKNARPRLVCAGLGPSQLTCTVCRPTAVQCAHSWAGHS